MKLLKEIGRVKQLFRYPVKSMAGEPLDSIFMGWHGFDGDRRFAFIRTGIASGLPWLTASKLPRLIRYKPLHRDSGKTMDLPTHVLTPDGQELDLRGETLRQELACAYGAPIEVMQLDQGIFDEATISIISHSTIQAIEKEAGTGLDISRFRPNILV